MHNLTGEARVRVHAQESCAHTCIRVLCANVHKALLRASAKDLLLIVLPHRVRLRDSVIPLHRFHQKGPSEHMVNQRQQGVPSPSERLGPPSRQGHWRGLPPEHCERAAVPPTSMVFRPGFPPLKIANMSNSHSNKAPVRWAVHSSSNVRQTQVARVPHPTALARCVSL